MRPRLAGASLEDRCLKATVRPWTAYETALGQLDAMGAHLSQLRERAEIADLVADPRERAGTVAARSRWPSTLSRRPKNLIAAERRRAGKRRSVRVAASNGRCDALAGRHGCGTPLASPNRRRLEQRKPHGRRRASRMGRRHPGAPDVPTAIICRGDRRCPSGRHPCGARGRTCSTPPACIVCCRPLLGLPQPVYHHHRPDPATPRDASCPNRPAPPACASCGLTGATPAISAKHGITHSAVPPIRPPWTPKRVVLTFRGPRPPPWDRGRPGRPPYPSPRRR